MVIEEAIATRTCRCGKKIEKGTLHVAEYISTQYGSKRVNLCKKCALEEINKTINEYHSLYKEVKKL